MPKNFTIEEVISIWRDKGQVIIVADLAENVDVDGAELRGGKLIRIINNKHGNEQRLREHLITARSEIWVVNLTAEEIAAKAEHCEEDIIPYCL